MKLKRCEATLVKQLLQCYTNNFRINHLAYISFYICEVKLWDVLGGVLGDWAPAVPSPLLLSSWPAPPPRPHCIHLVFLPQPLRCEVKFFPSCGSACAQREPRAHTHTHTPSRRLWSLRSGGGTDHPPLALIHSPNTGQVSVRRVKLRPDTGNTSEWSGHAANTVRGHPLPARPPTGHSLLRSPGVSVLGSLRRCCFFLCLDAVSIPHGLVLHLTAGGEALRSGQRLRVGRSVACLRSAARVARWSGAVGPGETRLSAARCAAADRRWERLPGRTDTPCGHFTPGAAPPLSFKNTPAQQRRPPATASKCMHLQSSSSPDTPGWGGGGCRGTSAPSILFQSLLFYN